MLDANPFARDGSARWPATIGLLAVGVLALPQPLWAEAGGVGDQEACRVCHAEPQFSQRSLANSAHRKENCRACHMGYQLDAAVLVEEAAGPAVDALAQAGFHQPVALAACVSCHDDATAAAAIFEHARPAPGKPPLDAKTAREQGLPYCLECHGDAHAIAKYTGGPAVQRRRAMSERCIACHTDDKVMARFGRSAQSVHEYQHTLHARKLELGSTTAPSCIDCHPAHKKAKDKALAAGTVCAACHQGVGRGFEKLANHQPIDAASRPVSYWTIKFFAWLTFLTIFGLGSHVLLDVAGVIRRSWKRRVHAHVAPDAVPLEALVAASAGRVDRSGRVLRFDGWQRMAHGVMALSFTTLVLTGWPLSTSGIGASHALVAAFGGLVRLGWLHRVAAVGLILACVLHLAYLAVRAAQGQLRWSMLPRPKDVKDLIDNVGWFVGLRARRPMFDRFSYFEKFDYWAVFWGCVIMIGSGAVRWFPDTVMRFAPPWLYEVAFLAHTDEALLAALAIFLWHFYNVHLRPAVFPMSWVYLHGRMTLQEHAEEHAAEHAAWLAAAQEHQKKTREMAESAAEPGAGSGPGTGAGPGASAQAGTASSASTSDAGPVAPGGKP